MCGISSLFHNMKTVPKKIDTLMAHAMWTGAIRGFHSTGIIYQADTGVDIYKKSIPGYDFIQLPVVQSVLNGLHKTPYYICHNRAATRGEVTHTNAHPFQFDHITGVHNGTLSGYFNLTPQGVNHPVDSMHLYDALSRDGFEDLHPRINGSFNLLWHDAKDNTIHLCKNTDRPYYFAKVKGEPALLGMSEKDHLKWLMGRADLSIEYAWSPSNNIEYIWEVEGDMVKPADKRKHKPYEAPPAKPYSPPPNNYQQRNGHTPAVQTKGADLTKIELIEFFVDTFTRNNIPGPQGQVTYTVQGETIDSEEVIIYMVPQGQLELDTWYTGRGCWVDSPISGGEYWRVWGDTVKPHPLENPAEAICVCINCGQDYMESDVVYVDHAPVCVGCCKSLSVQPDQLDDKEDVIKLIEAH